MLGPLPAWVWRGRVWGRLVLAAFLPFWLYTPLFVGWYWLTDGSAGDGWAPFLAATAAIFALGAFPLATWPCRWEFRLPLVVAYAAVQAVALWWWTLFLVDWL